MSLNGWQRVELERQRQEDLRLEGVRKRCRALLTACDHSIAAINDAGVQQLATDGLRRVKRRLKEVSAHVDQAPDSALTTIETTQKDLHRVIARAEAAARKWSEQQTHSKAHLAELRAQVEATKEICRGRRTEALAELERKVAEAAVLQNAGSFAAANTTCVEAEALIEQANKEAFDETVRREVVRGLLSTLTDMGFSVEGPRISKDNGNAGVVTLVGNLPSGRRARFEVALNGRMSFDLDGYQGQTCGEHIKEVQESLQERFGLKLGPPQITWKNPDRISKGSRDLPGGGAHHTARA